MAKKENELEELERLLSYEKARQSFGDFVHFMKADYQENWHHRIIIDRLERLMHEKDKRVMISLAPRHGKSELVSRQFPCYYLGCNPDAEIIAASYSSSLATMFSRDVQRGMDSEKYQMVFPDTVMAGTERAKAIELFSQRAKRTTDYFEIVGRKGKFTSVGVGGAVTGKGGTLILLDDPVKNAEEADSEVYREKIYDWYTSTLYTRCEKGANILLIMTRWHKDDLAGRLIEGMKEPGADQWEIIELPAINIHGPNSYDPRQVGEALWPNKYPVERLNVIRKQLGSRNWSSLYQSSPIIVGGNIIKEEWIQYYDKLPFDLTNHRSHRLITSWDLSFKETGKSYVVGVVLAKYGCNFYLIDIYRKKAGMGESLRAIQAMAKKYPKCRSILVEDKANGSGVIDLLRGKVPITPVTPEVSKDERLHSVEPIFEAGNFFLPVAHPERDNIVQELISFPMSVTDDIVDAISQGLNKFMTLNGLDRLRASTRWK